MQRTDSAPRGYTETAFTHTDRSARPEYDRIRALIEEWFELIPQAERHDLQRRFTSGDDIAFHAAFLELYIHKLLVATGHSVLFHPNMPGATTRPDFLARNRDGVSTLIECTLATEVSDNERAANARMKTLLESINRLDCADYFLSLRINGSPNSPVPIKRWYDALQKWIESLDYDAVLAHGPVPVDEELPSIELVHDGLFLTVKPMPKKPEARGKDQRPIGVESFEGCMVTSHKAIQAKIREKASRYGSLSHPYIIVVNCLGDLADFDEMQCSMFGHEGIWANPAIPKHRRVSAVIAIDHLMPWTAAIADAYIFHNPNSSTPYSGTLNSLPQVRHKAEIEGLHPRNFIQLEETWPRC